VFTLGKITASTRATGTTASNTERVFIDNQTVLSAVESGKREKEWHGWTNFEIQNYYRAYTFSVNFLNFTKIFTFSNNFFLFFPNELHNF
jgi:hypothetical protein